VIVTMVGRKEEKNCARAASLNPGTKSCLCQYLLLKKKDSLNNNSKKCILKIFLCDKDKKKQTNEQTSYIARGSGFCRSVLQNFLCTLRAD
jgi:hypothetical protein